MAEEKTTQTQGGDLQPREKEVVEREGIRPGPVFRPDVDIVETQSEFFVTADLPGVDDAHVSVKLEDGILSIDATPAVEPEKSWTPLYAEYRQGGYHRQFRLSDAIADEAIRATMRDGVLELHLPKTDRHQPRQIEVRSG